MKRRRGIIVLGIIAIAIVAGLVAFGALALLRPAKPPVKAAAVAPTTAFRPTTGVLPPGWHVSTQAANYLNLAGSNGCFTTSTLEVADDYQNLSSVDRFDASFAQRFIQNGYTLSGVSVHPLKVNTSGTIESVNAIYYELSAGGNTTYHIDGGAKGTTTYAFMSVSCPTKTQLENAQTALLGVTYNTTYKP